MPRSKATIPTGDAFPNPSRKSGIRRLMPALLPGPAHDFVTDPSARGGRTGAVAAKEKRPFPGRAHPAAPWVPADGANTPRVPPVRGAKGVLGSGTRPRGRGGSWELWPGSEASRVGVSGVPHSGTGRPVGKGWCFAGPGCGGGIAPLRCSLGCQRALQLAVRRRATV